MKVSARLFVILSVIWTGISLYAMSFPTYGQDLTRQILEMWLIPIAIFGSLVWAVKGFQR